MKAYFSIPLLAMALIAAGPAGAAPSYSNPSISESFRNGSTLVEYEMYEDALRYLHKADREDPDNADILNLIAFSYRKLGKYDQAYRYYQRALRIDPHHKGANEYLGELYVETNRPEKARQQLARLEEICTRRCAEYQRLKKIIAGS